MIILGGAVIALFGTSFLGLAALQDTATYFYTPTEIVAQHVPPGEHIRLGGMVVPESVHRDPQKGLRFMIGDTKTTRLVYYQGIAPDLFREGQGVVAEGVLTRQGVFQATYLLAKHDENYMPPKVARATQKMEQYPARYQGSP